MNIPNALRYLFPNAEPQVDYRVRDEGNGPYIAQWNLPGQPPTAAQLQAASDAYDVAQATAQAQQAALRTQVVTLAQSSVGQSVNTLSPNQVRALLVFLLYKAGAITSQGTVKPLGEWLDD